MTPVILYTSAGIPVGARAIVKFYRPPSADDTSPNYAAGVTKPKVAQPVAFGAEATGTDLGSFVIEDVGIELSGSVSARGGTFGEDVGDPALVRKDPTLSMTAQMAAAGTPTLCPGDYCVLYLGMKATSTAAAPVPIPASRWFVNSDSIAQSGVNKFGLRLSLDRVNSDPNLSEF